MPKHNNALQRPHLRKDWRRHIKTWFDQPARKNRRLQKRRERASTQYPKPLHKLRPVVHKSTARYSGQTRVGRGFTLDELKGANILPQFARTVGITVDERRSNKSVELLQLNVNRLKAYIEKLVLLPRKEGKPKKGIKGTLNDATQKIDAVQNTHKDVLPIVQGRKNAKDVKITKEMNEFRAHSQLRLERMKLKHVGKKAVAQEEAK